MRPIWVSVVAIGIVAGAAAVGASALARADFLGRITRLQRVLDDAPRPLAVRADLPSEVQALAQRLGASASGSARLVRLIQSGEMWLKPGEKPLSFKARQSNAVAEVGFLWQALFRTGGLSMRVIDFVVGSEGGLEGRLFGVLPIVRTASDDAAYRAEAMRYLAELMWNPDALLLNRQLDWRVIDKRTLSVAIGEGARRSEIRLILDEAGNPVRAEADDRPRAEGSVSKPCPWFARGGDYQTIGGRRIPTRGEAGWILDGVEFVYFRGRIESWSLEQ